KDVAIGYVAYDANRHLYNIGNNLDDELEMPDYHFMLYQTIVVYEHHTETAHIITVNIDEVSETELNTRLQKIKEELDQHIPISDPEAFPFTFKPQISKTTFMENVKKARSEEH